MRYSSFPRRDWNSRSVVRIAAISGAESRVGDMAKGQSAKHTGCRRGTKVLVKLRDGTAIADVFYERTKSHVILREHGRIAKADIRSFQVLRGNLKMKYEGK